MMFQPLIFALMCAALGIWFGRNKPWEERKALLALPIVAALATIIGMNGAMAVVGCVGLGTGFVWARRVP
jgi:hypothetical protein